uniref:Cytochrome P450 89A2 n=1 Tax=Aegilops tauschii subsp. strangulata TaxID=200361 RepID=A0A453R023_AEGTS
MQDVILLLLSMAVHVVVSSLLRRAPPFKEMQTRLAAAKWALVRDFSAALRQDVVVTDRVTAHHLLVRGGAGGAFCNRPPTSAASSVLSRQRHHNIGSAPYGPLWRGIRRNLVSEVFHPSRLRVYAPARRRALCGLVADLREQCTSSNDGLVLAAESIHAALFGLSAAMCFGDGVDPGRVRAMADGMEDLIRSLVGLRVFAALPALTELIYRQRWNKLVTLRRQQEEMYLPLIDARRGLLRRPSGEAPTYVDTLIDLLVGDDNSASGAKAPKQRLADGEFVGLCSEFLGAGTEPAAAALQWIMANLVKHLDVQEAVRSEIDAVVGADAEEVSEEDLGKLEYLNAVLMEALRLHPTVPSVARQGDARRPRFSRWSSRRGGDDGAVPPGAPGAGRDGVGRAGQVYAGEVPCRRRGQRREPRGGGRKRRRDQDDAVRGRQEDVPWHGCRDAPPWLLRGQPREGVRVDGGGRRPGCPPRAAGRVLKRHETATPCSARAAE